MGNNKLIQQGAKLVVSTEDILEELKIKQNNSIKVNIFFLILILNPFNIINIIFIKIYNIFKNNSIIFLKRR